MQRNILLTLLACSLISACDIAQKPASSIEVATKGIHGAALSDDGTHSAIGSIHHGGSYWAHDTQERLYNWNHKERLPNR